MSKLTKQLRCQQRINQGTQKLMKHFGEEVDLKCYYMRMAKTQAQAISLIRIFETNDDPEGKNPCAKGRIAVSSWTAAPCSVC